MTALPNRHFNGPQLRRADRGHLTRFTLDRLVGIINRLGSRVEVKLEIRPAARVARESEVA